MTASKGRTYLPIECISVGLFEDVNVSPHDSTTAIATSMASRPESSTTSNISKTYDHITPDLQKLHWLPVYHSIQFSFKSFFSPSKLSLPLNHLVPHSPNLSSTPPMQPPFTTSQEQVPNPGRQILHCSYHSSGTLNLNLSMIAKTWLLLKPTFVNLRLMLHFLHVMFFLLLMLLYFVMALCPEYLHSFCYS